MMGILGKVPASALGLHPFSLPRAVNDSLRARIFGGQLSQSGRLLPVAALVPVSTPFLPAVNGRFRAS